MEPRLKLAPCMRSSSLTSKAKRKEVTSIVVVDCSTEEYVLCFKAKIMSEGKIEKTILWQLDSCQRKQPIFEKIELKVNTFVLLQKRGRKFKVRMKEGKPICTTRYEPHD